jgi:ribonucleoside-diphosphate reductase alpha chain
VNAVQEFTYTRTYSKWLVESKKREVFEESVDRFIDFITFHRGGKIPPKVLRKIKEYILRMEVVPSMRFFWSAGPAAERDNTCIYNCAYQGVDSIQAFSECLFILMCGTGYGFSVQQEHINKLPVVPGFTSKGAGEYVVADSKEGWATSIQVLLQSLWSGADVSMVYKELRGEGARLQTMGGRSSGPAPLLLLHNFIRETFAKAQGRRLTTLECHDILNQEAEVTVCGGVRRSSEISLSDLDDQEMETAKEWPFPPRRSMANNSAVYLERPSASRFLKEWAGLANSGTGERGIFNLGGARATAPIRRNSALISGTNPCLEILLRSRQFCNLSEVVIRPEDDVDTLLDKVETAAWIGAIQSTFTHFPYLNKRWAKNCNEERLLGVSLTGQYDNYALADNPTVLSALKRKVLKVAAHASKKLGVPMSAATTCGKPSGTVSQLVNCASGAHARYSPYHIRRFRIAGTDPLYHMLRSQGLPFYPEVGQKKETAMTWVCEFPVKCPPSSIFRNEVSASDQLNHYLTVQKNWCEHNQSITIYVKPEEWFSVGEMVYTNWEHINGVSFLPYDGGHYQLAPYEEITKEEYDKRVLAFPQINYSQLSKFETTEPKDTTGSWACTGDKCELE